MQANWMNKLLNDTSSKGENVYWNETKAVQQFQSFNRKQVKNPMGQYWIQICYSFNQWMRVCMLTRCVAQNSINLMNLEMNEYAKLKVSTCHFILKSLVLIYTLVMHINPPVKQGRSFQPATKLLELWVTYNVFF